jgi:hypothetical protein
MEQNKSLSPGTKQFDRPFRISNRGFDEVDRYLSFDSPHAVENKLLVTSDSKRL